MHILKTLLVLLLVTPIISSAQNKGKQTDMLQVEAGTFSAPQFYVNNERVSFEKVSEIMSNNVNASKYLNKGQAQFVFGNVLGFIGSFAMGWQGGNLILGKATRLDIIGGGAAVVGLGILLQNASKNSFNKAFDIFQERRIGYKGQLKYSYGLAITDNNSIAFNISF